jgi:hypothetical protein
MNDTGAKLFDERTEGLVFSHVTSRSHGQRSKADFERIKPGQEWVTDCFGRR